MLMFNWHEVIYQTFYSSDYIVPPFTFVIILHPDSIFVITFYPQSPF